MTPDPTRARELVERLRQASAVCHCDGCHTKRSAADLIESLLAERETLAKDVARWRALLAMDSPTVCECADGEWVPVHPLRIVDVVDAAMGASDDQG